MKIVELTLEIAVVERRKWRTECGDMRVKRITGS
jgi:hypothetical protein